MENKKSKVVKSKSSNSAAKKSTNKLKHNNKKSKSNGSFQSLVMKKRGVYVEKKYELLNKEESNLTIETDWATRKPNKDKKLFLPSVLKLLSKKSAGTQYRDVDVKDKKPKTATEITENTDGSTDRIVVPKLEKKLKYKSRILNSDSYIEDQFEVLQSKNNFYNTPSQENSDIGFVEDEDFDNIKWSKLLPRLVKPDEEELQLEKEKKLSHLLKEVTEGKMIKLEQFKVEQKEPATLTTHVKKKAPLAVDFIKPMFSADDKSEALNEQEFQTVVSSKTQFKVDNATPNFSTEYALNTSRFLHNYNDIDQRDDKSTDNYSFPKPIFKPGKHRPSRALRKKHLYQISSYQSEYDQIKNKGHKLSRKANKRNLMNLLKKELSMDVEQLAEPQNLYQALKQIAKNNRKSQKTIRFDSSDLEDDQKCVFTRRKTISSNKYKPGFNYG